VSASFGNDLSTLPDFPAEIRAPAGTVNGVSSFQVHISDHDITTPGDEPNVLVAMNPAALKADLHRLETGGTLILNEDAFDERNLEKAEYTSNPLDDGTIAGYRVIKVPMTSMTKEACEPLGVKPRDAERSKNFFALGLVSFMYTRPIQPTLEWIQQKFAKNEQVAAANTAAFKAGFHFGETTEQVGHRYEVRPATLPAGEYTSITGNTALAWGLVAAGQLAKLPVMLGSYPITPASDILHELSRHKHFGIRTVQAEDEIAAAGMALGAAFAGHLGVTTTSGPGVALKSETISLAAAIELPMLIIDIQRGGPSTGLPTKTEAADLNIALYGRHGEAPLPVIASYTPGAVLPRRDRGGPHRAQVPHPGDPALRRLPGQRLRAVVDCPTSSRCPTSRSRSRPSSTAPTTRATRCTWPYLRDPDTLARPWAIPGTPGLMHRVGGLEKADKTGNVNYTPENHQLMGDLRQAKLDRIAADYPRSRSRATPTPTSACSVGLHLRSSPRRLAATAPGRPQAGVDPPRTPQPAAQRPRRLLKRFPKVLVPELNRASSATSSGPSTWSTRSPSARCRGSRSGPPRSKPHRGGPRVSDTAVTLTTKKDWASDQEVRWCPGCGDYGILQAVQQLMPDLGVAPENTVFISGIGCSSRFPYYMNTYGMHSIHGRAPAIATGLAVARPDLDVWVITGDGDGLSIGGNHLIHALRRNVNLTILLFNNRIYGLTKGQYSPTSEVGKVTKSTPFGSIDPPFNPLAVALGAEASFVARTHDLDRQHMMQSSRRRTTTRGPRSSRSTRTATCSTTASSTTSPSAACATR
jgi:2-oxoglutarate/2-oxoacid ferredoxin oxidoreductase subunit alpha